MTDPVATEPARSGRRAIVAFLGALAIGAVGVGVGYMLWGIPKDWYAGHDPAKLPPGPENDLVRYGWNIVVRTADIIGKSATDPALRYCRQ